MSYVRNVSMRNVCYFSIFLVINFVSLISEAKLPLTEKQAIEIQCKQLKFNCNRIPSDPLRSAIQSCQTIMATTYCQDMKKESEYFGDFRSCDIQEYCEDALTDEHELWVACKNGFLEGTGEIFSKVIEWAKKASESAEALNSFYKDKCDLNCKKLLVRDLPGYSGMDEITLERTVSQFTGSQLYTERQRKENILKSLQRNQPIQSLQHQVQNAEKIEQVRAKSDIPSNFKVGPFFGAVTDFFDKKKTRLECLKAPKRIEMMCWGAAYIVDPMLVYGAAKNGTQGAKMLLGLIKDNAAVASIKDMSTTGSRVVNIESSALKIETSNGARGNARNEFLVRSANRESNRVSALEAHLNQHILDDGQSVSSISRKIDDVVESISLKKPVTHSEKKEIYSGAISRKTGFGDLIGVSDQGKLFSRIRDNCLLQPFDYKKCQPFYLKICSNRAAEISCDELKRMTHWTPEMMRKVESGLMEAERKLFDEIEKKTAAEFELLKRKKINDYLESLKKSNEQLTPDERVIVERLNKDTTYWSKSDAENFVSTQMRECLNYNCKGGQVPSSWKLVDEHVTDNAKYVSPSEQVSGLVKRYKTSYEVDGGVTKVEVVICSSPRCPGPSAGAPPINQGDIVSIYPVCGPSVTLIESLGKSLKNSSKSLSEFRNVVCKD